MHRSDEKCLQDDSYNFTSSAEENSPPSAHCPDSQPRLRFEAVAQFITWQTLRTSCSRITRSLQTIYCDCV